VATVACRIEGPGSVESEAVELAVLAAHFDVALFCPVSAGPVFKPCSPIGLSSYRE